MLGWVTMMILSVFCWVCWGYQNSRSRRIWASRTTAAAKVRATVSAAAGNTRGWSTDALDGQRTMTTAGGLIGLYKLNHELVDCIDLALASSVTLDIGIPAPS